MRTLNQWIEPRVRERRRPMTDTGHVVRVRGELEEALHALLANSHHEVPSFLTRPHQAEITGAEERDRPASRGQEGHRVIHVSVVGRAARDWLRRGYLREGRIVGPLSEPEQVQHCDWSIDTPL